MAHVTMWAVTVLEREILGGMGWGKVGPAKFLAGQNPYVFHSLSRTAISTDEVGSLVTETSSSRTMTS